MRSVGFYDNLVISLNEPKKKRKKVFMLSVAPTHFDLFQNNKSYRLPPQKGVFKWGT